uniref:Uncharacterized protein n=1 Tax=Dunaliella tertiolecta TaxID=3047 RepID=A0A7S3VKA3_DUNTE
MVGKIASKSTTDASIKMSREVFWDDFDGNAIGVDVGVKSLGMQQYGGITCKQVLHLRQPRSRSRRGRPFEELSALSPACYEENSRDDDADWKSRGSYKVPQRGRAQKWDRSKDAEDYTVEMAGKDGPAVREELRWLCSCVSALRYLHELEHDLACMCVCCVAFVHVCTCVCLGVCARAHLCMHEQTSTHVHTCKCWLCLSCTGGPSYSSSSRA